MRLSPARQPPPYKLLSLLFQYPDAALLARRAELAETIQTLPNDRARTAIMRFAAYFITARPLQLQQEYVTTFDLQKRSGLYLTYYTEGDTRKRGMALLRLKRIYAAAGLPLEGRELSDYLPVVLEFAALAPQGLGAHILGEHRTALEVLRTQLRGVESPYRHLVDAVCFGLPGLRRADLDTVKRVLKEGPPHEEVGLQPFAPPEVMPVTGARR